MLSCALCRTQAAVGCRADVGLIFSTMTGRLQLKVTGEQLGGAALPSSSSFGVSAPSLVSHGKSFISPPFQLSLLYIILRGGASDNYLPSETAPDLQQELSVPREAKQRLKKSGGIQESCSGSRFRV